MGIITYINRPENFMPRSVSLLTLYHDVQIEEKQHHFIIIGTLLKRKGTYKYKIDLKDDTQSDKINYEELKDIETDEGLKLRFLREFNQIQLETAVEFLDTKTTELAGAGKNQNKIKPLEWDIALIRSAVAVMIEWFRDEGFPDPEIYEKFLSIE